MLGTPGTPGDALAGRQGLPGGGPLSALRCQRCGPWVSWCQTGRGPGSGREGRNGWRLAPVPGPPTLGSSQKVRFPDALRAERYLVSRRALAPWGGQATANTKMPHHAPGRKVDSLLVLRQVLRWVLYLQRLT